MNFQNEDMAHNFHTNGNNRDLLNFSKEENSDILPHSIDHHHHTAGHGTSGNNNGNFTNSGPLSSQQKKAK